MSAARNERLRGRVALLKGTEVDGSTKRVVHLTPHAQQRPELLVAEEYHIATQVIRDIINHWIDRDFTGIVDNLLDTLQNTYPLDTAVITAAVDIVEKRDALRVPVLGRLDEQSLEKLKNVLVTLKAELQQQA